MLPSMKIVKYSDVPYTILSMNEICFDSASIKLRRIEVRRRFLRCFSAELRGNTGRLVRLQAVSIWSDFDDCHVEAVAFCSRPAYLFA